MIIFLDFDGTLHPNWSFSERGGRQVAAPYAGPWFVEAPTLASIIEPYSNHIDIVIASWWAYTRSIDEITELLPLGVASRVVGSIWLPQYLDCYRVASMSRYRSIQLWLDHQGIGSSADWIALDDDDRGWPPELRDHLVHAQGTLANPAVRAALYRRLEDMLAR